MFLKYCLISLIILVFSISKLKADNNYSFLVAGHAYGAHAGNNKGLHPPFLQHLASNIDTSDFALFLTGDIVNQSNEASWQQAAKE